MKQHITSAQWEELDGKQMVETGLFDEDYPWQKMNIGQMIEFLGNGWQYKIFDENLERKNWPEVSDEDYELCDALWEAIKNKLK